MVSSQESMAQWCGLIGLLTWAGSWSPGLASMRPAGGKVEGLKKTVLANLSGVFWAWDHCAAGRLDGKLSVGARGCCHNRCVLYVRSGPRSAGLHLFPDPSPAARPPSEPTRITGRRRCRWSPGRSWVTYPKSSRVWLVKISTKKTEQKAE